ncbi:MULTISPECIES: hypothetical protein [unclassified Sphingopyxis]|uniref:hypothetical protein n=1 Tax=unclassified Sphingopyxis TaxID=2614943 RepID=UPI00285C22CE|nr:MULTISPECIES: hypothetical protein [unclassified Sphingopyxis]MDR6833503.1 hypothetical protein [Sphingopyxis sp. BE122]MDR7225772.1 hypothetical protein [Sphingopyxis sp. BE259]
MLDFLQARHFGNRCQYQRRPIAASDLDTGIHFGQMAIVAVDFGVPHAHQKGERREEQPEPAKD